MSMSTKVSVTGYIVTKSPTVPFVPQYVRALLPRFPLHLGGGTHLLVSEPFFGKEHTFYLGFVFLYFEKFFLNPQIPITLNCSPRA